jgi:circadian clock protein KaiB
MSKLIFKIYVAGLTMRNRQVINTFTNACAEQLQSTNYEIITVDIIKNPADAELDKILATPTIVREKPKPQKRTIGDLRESGNARRALEFLTEDFTNLK